MKRNCRGAVAALTRLIGAGALWLFSVSAQASGTSPYLPLNLSPEIEREVERVLVLGGRAILKRPVPITLRRSPALHGCFAIPPSPTNCARRTTPNRCTPFWPCRRLPPPSSGSNQEFSNRNRKEPATALPVPARF